MRENKLHGLHRLHELQGCVSWVRVAYCVFREERNEDESKYR
jgi:hypothetical protein